MTSGLVMMWFHSIPIYRVLFGSNHLYVFHHSTELSKLVKSGKKPAAVTYDLAQGEIASNSGFDMSTEGKSKEDLLLQQDLISLMPMVYEANAISEELNRKVGVVSRCGFYRCMWYTFRKKLFENR